jgi:O-antigen ligase
MKKILPAFDLYMLGLMILSLPSLEAPKNFFLVGFLLTRLTIEIIQFKKGMRLWFGWDTCFMMIVFTALLSTLYAGMPHREEWRGFGVFMTAILTAWFLSRAQYSRKNYQGLFILIILGAIPALLWGLYQYLIILTKPNLQLHSVGHVNHSAIYLVMIFGASLGWFMSHLDKFKAKLSNLYILVIGVLILALFIIIIMTESRAAYGVSIILSLLIIKFIGQNTKIKIASVISIISIVILSIFFETPVIQEQINNQKSNNILALRDKVWNVSLEASRFHPLFGIGLSNWHFISLEDLRVSVESRGEKFNPKNYFFPGHSHNLYLSALVERGFVGLLVTILFMVFWITHLIRTFNWAKKTSQAAYLWAGSLCAFITTYAIGLVNTTFHHEHGILACLFLGLYLSYTRAFFKNNSLNFFR